MNKGPAIFIGVLLLLSGRLYAIDSLQSGDWSNPLTGQGGVVPTANDPVVVQNGHVVTVDTTTAQALSVTVEDIGSALSFSRTSSATLTLSAGDLTVDLGAALDMGTEAGVGAGPIPAGVKATLVLAPGTPGQYGLIILPGGSFTARGADKDLVALAMGNLAAGSAVSLQVQAAEAEGWEVGDTITIGQTERAVPWESHTVERVVTGISGGDPVTVSWSVGQPLQRAHTAAVGIRVANLTRNVVVRSSGTDVALNTSYLTSHTQPAQFRAVQTEFSYLGAPVGNRSGIRFNSASSGGTISSCTVHNGNAGIRSFSQGGLLLERSVFYGNVSALPLSSGGGAVVAFNDVAGSLTGEGISCGLGDVLTSNHVYSNAGGGVDARQDGAVESNQIYANNGMGLSVNAASRVFVADNDVHRNTDEGIFVSASSSVFVRNAFRSNGGIGVDFSGGGGNLWAGNVSHSNLGNGLMVRSAVGGNVFLSEAVYGNNGRGLDTAGSFGNLYQDCLLGYDPSGGAAANGGGNLRLNDTFPSAATLKGCHLLSENFIGDIEQPGSYVLSFNQDFATGTVRLNGDFTLTGDLTLDHAQPTYRSTATAPVLLRGTGHSASVASTSEANAVSQVVSIRYDGSVWRVEGTSTSLSPATHPGNGSTVDYGQFQLQFAAGAPQTGDRLAFALMASSRDQNRQKRLLIGNNDPVLNGGRSRITVAPAGSLTLRGIGAARTVLDRINPADNFFSFLSSGSLTLENAFVQNTDGQGLRMTGSGNVAISSTTFDFLGNTGPTLAYLSPSALTSNATFYNVTFLDTPNRAGGGFTIHSVNAPGAGPGLRWYFAGFGGAISGDASDNDPNRRIFWADSTAPSAPGGPFTAAPGANSGEVALSWTSPGDDGGVGLIQGGSFRLFRSTNPADLAGAAPAQAQIVLAAAAAAPGSAQGTVDPGLTPETVYHYRLWAGDEFDNFSSPVQASAQAAGQIPAPQLQSAAVGPRTVGVLWTEPMTMAFSKPMNTTAVTGAVSLTRLGDNLGVSLSSSVPVDVAWDPGRTAFTVSPLGELAGNSLYELAVTTAAVDDFGKGLASSSTLRFTTLMDRTEPNVLSSGTLRVDVPPWAFASNGYVVDAAVPAGTAAAATQKLLSNTGDALRTPLPSSLAGLEALDAGQNPMVFAAPVTVTIPYADADRDGVVDGSEVKARTLSVHWLDQERNLWRRLPSRVGAGTVSAEAPHFTVFALIGAADAALADGRAFPSPYVAGPGAPAEVTFADVGQFSAVRIYTSSGRLVREAASDSFGEFKWDLKNGDGEPVAAGLYLYRVTNGGSVLTGKLAVIK